MSTHKEFIGSFTRKLRDMECDLRKSADEFLKLVATETAAVQAEKANLIDRIVGTMIRDGEAWKPVETVEIVTGAEFGKPLPVGEWKKTEPVKCHCGGNPICIQHVMPAQVVTITAQDPIEDDPQIPIHQSFRCLKCGKESEARENLDGAITEWNKANP